MGKLFSASYRKKIKSKKFVAAVVETADPTQAAMAAGYKPENARAAASRMLSDPKVQEAIDESLSEAAKQSGINRAWVLMRLKEVVERCMRAIPVLDRNGEPTGEYKFDSGGANRALELIGKHLRLFGEDDNANARLGNAMLRALAQEAISERALIADAQIVTPTANPPPGPGPINPTEDGTETSVSASASPGDQHLVSPPPSVKNEPLNQEVDAL